MADFKQVFDAVARDVLDAGYSVEAFVEWLAQKKKGGENLDSWRVDEITLLIQEFKKLQSTEAVQSNSRSRASGDTDDDDIQDNGQAAHNLRFDPTLVHSVTVVK